MDLQLAELGPPARETRREAACLLPDADEDILEKLERRLGRLHARQRIGIEGDHEARMLGRGLGFFHPRKWRRSPTIIRGALKLTGLYRRARKNAERIQIRHQDILLPQLPPAFDGFTLLQISDLHVDLNEGAMQRLIELLPGLAYDLCVLTGDYRGKTFGPIDATIAGMARVCSHLVAPIYGVLGNHDSIRMVPALEEMGIRVLLNEAETIERGGRRIHLVGIDDAHYYRLDSIEKAASPLPDDEFSIPRRPDLPARRDPNHARGRVTPAIGVGIVAIPRHGRLHLGWGRVLRPPRTAQLPSRNCPASSAVCRR